MIPSSMGGVPAGSSFMNRSWLVRGPGARNNDVIVTSLPQSNTVLMRRKNHPSSKVKGFPT